MAVRTDPVVAAASDGDAAQDEAPAKLAFNEVRLSDGRIVTLTETTAAEEDANEALLGRMGYSPHHGLDFMRFQRAKAVLAIEQIDGERRRPPRTKDELKAFMMTLRSRDTNLVMRKYSELNGLGDEDDESFRDDVESAH